MYVLHFKQLTSKASVFSAAVIGMIGLNVGCNAKMADCIVKCKSELHTLSEHGTHLISAIAQDGTAEIDVESEELSEALERKAEQAAELTPNVQEAKSESASVESNSEASTAKAPVVDSAKAGEVTNGEVVEKSFEDPSTLDKPTKLLPNERPDWTTSADKITGEDHVLVINTSTYSSYEGSLAKLPERAYNRFSEYSKETLGIDIKEFKAITPEWVTERLIKGHDSEFVAEVMDSGAPTYVAWAKLDISPATREELQAMYRRSQSYPRSFKVVSYMLSAIAFFGLAHVGFNLISSVQPKKK